VRFRVQQQGPEKRDVTPFGLQQQRLKVRDIERRTLDTRKKADDLASEVTRALEVDRMAGVLQ
jgi:hypothetical protein